MYNIEQILAMHGTKLTLGCPMRFPEPSTGDELDGLLEQVREFLKRQDSSEDTSTVYPIQKAVTIIFAVEVLRARLQRAHKTREAAASHWSKFSFERWTK